jgi:hypothetical protein
MVQAQACLSTVLAQLLGCCVRCIGQVSPLCCCVTPTHSACNQHLLFSKINGIIIVFIRETNGGHSLLQSRHHHTHTTLLGILQENCFVILCEMTEVCTQ